MKQVNVPPCMLGPVEGYATVVTSPEHDALRFSDALNARRVGVCTAM